MGATPIPSGGRGPLEDLRVAPTPGPTPPLEPAGEVVPEDEPTPTPSATPAGVSSGLFSQAALLARLRDAETTSLEWLAEGQLDAFDLTGARATSAQLRGLDRDRADLVDARIDLAAGDAASARARIDGLEARLDEDSPLRSRVLTAKAGALAAANDAAGALAAAEAAVRADPADPRAREELVFRTIASTRDLRPGAEHPALKVGEEALKAHPGNRTIERHLSTITPPDPLARARAQPAIDAGSAAYLRAGEPGLPLAERERRHAEAFARAEDALAEAPRDAVAHQLRLDARRGLAAVRAAVARSDSDTVLPRFRDPAHVDARIKEARAAGVDRLVQGFDRFTSREQAAIAESVLPLRRWIEPPPAGAVRIADPDRHVASLQEHERVRPDGGGSRGPKLETDRTNDGRYFGSVSFHSEGVVVANRGALQEALNGGQNTLAHEFAHLVHDRIRAQDPTLAGDIQLAWGRASLGGRGTLDYYAAGNDREYFAQGYEAYLAEAKPVRRDDVQDNTRSELAREDPALFNLVARAVGDEPIDWPATPTPRRSIADWLGATPTPPPRP